MAELQLDEPILASNAARWKFAAVLFKMASARHLRHERAKHHRKLEHFLALSIALGGLTLDQEAEELALTLALGGLALDQEAEELSD